MINILVMPLALEPTEHKSDGHWHIECSPRQEARQDAKKLQYQTWEISHSKGVGGLQPPTPPLPSFWADNINNNIELQAPGWSATFNPKVDLYYKSVTFINRS